MNASAAPTTERRTAASGRTTQEILPPGGRVRVVIENLSPRVDCGRFPAKRSAGEVVTVEADVFTDGHDKVSAALLHRRPGSDDWNEADMRPLVNDRWAGDFEVHAVGWHEFTVVAWVDRFATWRYDLSKRVAAGQQVEADLQIGAALVEEAAAANEGEVANSLTAFARFLHSDVHAEATEVGLSEGLAALMRRHAPRHFLAEWPSPVQIWVDRAKARFSTWYELFPRSTSPDPSRHGTLRDVEAKLDYVANMGFDVLYLPPIHPIGRAYRKGRNNSPVAEPGDVGSPWAIGGPEGGHDAIHPELGTIKDFDHLVAAAAKRGIEIALDLAFQCSPDHPYVKQHPEWFRHRPDGTIQYAENPPKKYQDIYPFDFECEDWQALWNELLRVVMHWVEHGVKIFRVDNPHTKPFPFWEWLIAEVKKREPSVLFLAEAFTRPKVMYRLAKLGFTQSYTYFAWRNDPWSIRQYFTELSTPPVVDFFRPNPWPNTPDILNEYLQTDARAAYLVRVILAATLSANYGIYGPAFELMEGRPVKKGSEEYLDSEKYQIRQWDWNSPHSLAELIGRLNQIRRSNRALQHDRGLRFHNVDNDSIVVYSKTSGDNIILVAVNTDPYHTQWGNIDLSLEALGIKPDQPFQVHDLLTDLRYRWQGYHAAVGLDPASLPAHVFAVRRWSRTEADFEYFV
ncbi:MAG TPA: alpha-1,4-glucan--maltose-1-phosphate maltosyltransferase [Tepidisphaeraceae bacterium]|nr:alpha-1,4-glucan--maltose-1-phosphate maltosyltransferase [Tepidisphaeraceae bacterium]